MKIEKLVFFAFMSLLWACGNPDYDQEKSEWIDTLEEIPQNDLKDVPINAPYSFETGIIEYESSTMGMTQQVITMFCNFGRTSRTEIITKMLGQSVKQLTLVNDTAIFNINLIDSTGSYILRDSLDEELNFRTLNKNDLQKHKITQHGQEMVLDKSCTIYEMYVEEQNAEIKNWVWEGITLKSVSSIGGLKVTMTAKKIRVNVKIPPENFELPVFLRIRKNESDSIIIQ